VLDIRRRAPLYVRDWTDAFHTKDLGKVIASVLFLFFAAISPAITFGNLYEKDSGGSFGVVETILATAVSGIVYSIMSGQPITILGATGPIFAYTIVCYDLSKSMSLEFLPFYFWTLMWNSLFTVLVVAFDLCAMMRHVTKFSEDIFAGLISIIFIVEAIKPAVKGFIDGKKGADAAFLEMVLLVLTYKLCNGLTNIRRTPWMTASVRATLANFGVVLAISATSGLAAVWGGINIDMLQISGSFQPTLVLPSGVTRSWLVSPLGVEGDFPAWAIFFAALPAVGFAVLGYLDQNLTTLLVNRPSCKLKKAPAYHLDLLVRGAVCTPLCAVLGLPLAVASTVPSITHLMSLTTYSIEKLTDGTERKVPVEVCEQRVTNLAIHALLAASLLFAAILQFVPKAVLFGVFLYMGISSLNGNELFERLLLLCIWDTKSYPQFAYVQNVSSRRMHLYTLIQAVCLGILYGLKEVKQTAVVFPFFMASLTIIRKCFRCVFTEEELLWLDGDGVEAEPDLNADLSIEVVAPQDGNPWQQNVEPDLEVPFGRGVTPLGKGESPWQGVEPGLEVSFARGVSPMPVNTFKRGISTGSGNGDVFKRGISTGSNAELSKRGITPGSSSAEPAGGVATSSKMQPTVLDGVSEVDDKVTVNL